MLEQLKDRVCHANLTLVEHGLVFQTWGNVSAIDRDNGLIVIKPSGVPYDRMTPESMVVVDLECRPIEAGLKPSVDTAIHAALYRAFPAIGGIAHTHSHYATCFAQACRPIPCLGTTHADYFHGDVPVAPVLAPADVATDYERHIGESLVFAVGGRSPLECPAVLAANHGPFTWGVTVEQAVENAIVLEEVARMAIHTFLLVPEGVGMPDYLLEKHFSRKHGKNKYYGQQEDVK
ncbi:MAG TPA: L-ribulose-5-phosphate 4-epimerase AraD [Candidatus Hydrogenedentes bacterium]|nr:L-ribulose-5-phosphate 4-epimerase AraD [Candidatus Hydrogenedentota bacterium]HOL76386.1 L-ribulose-5-phosphate 4-epimerase AraD [Candidatus Hydrogenedentota bacterium]HPO85424.1 L-ribulose-5-phosphate 4-epimerase AraD [Candidatus Hydrogenedentota bacterium]